MKKLRWWSSHLALPLGFHPICSQHVGPSTIILFILYKQKMCWYSTECNNAGKPLVPYEPQHTCPISYPIPLSGVPGMPQTTWHLSSARQERTDNVKGQQARRSTYSSWKWEAYDPITCSSSQKTHCNVNEASSQVTTEDRRTAHCHA